MWTLHLQLPDHQVKELTRTGANFYDETEL